MSPKLKLKAKIDAAKLIVNKLKQKHKQNLKAEPYSKTEVQNNGNVTAPTFKQGSPNEKGYEIKSSPPQNSLDSKPEPKAGYVPYGGLRRPPPRRRPSYGARRTHPRPRYQPQRRYPPLPKRPKKFVIVDASNPAPAPVPAPAPTPTQPKVFTVINVAPPPAIPTQKYRRIMQ